MKIMKLLNKLAILFLMGIFFLSCQDNNEIDLPLGNENQITENDARIIAENIFSVNGVNKTFEGHSKKVISIKSVPDENDGSNSYFIINYEKGGFLILAGDKRSEPILAYSENNGFPLDLELYPTGLVGWLYETQVKIAKLKSEAKESSDFIKQRWLELENNNQLKDEDPWEPDCTPYTIIKGPYLNTTWGQDCGYNSETLLLTCSPPLPCNHALTGCVATAMAQIMKYHEHPTNYDWSNMPNNYGTTTTATLMSDIGVAVDMDYDCDGSGTNTEDEVASSLINDFNYSSATYDDYDHQIVMNNLNYQKPVILKGGRKNGWWIFSTYSDGHSWVCDGYRHTIFPCYGSYLRFHMNWGWNNTFNGYYSFNNFNPDVHTFNYKRGMVYNINP